MQMSDELKRKSLSWLARQTAAMRLEVFALAMKVRREILNRLRAQPAADARNTPEIEEQALMTAIADSRKQRLKSSDALEAIAASRKAAAVSSGKNKSPKKNRLQILKPEIIKMKEAGMSYAEIATAVSTKTRKKVSRSYVHAVSKEFEK